MGKREKKWDRRVRDYLKLRFQDLPRATKHYGILWADHLDSGLAGGHFVSELTSGCDSKFQQRVWEMALARHLRACGHRITTRPEGEPDYRLEIDGRTVWVEAVSPTPGTDLPRNWTAFDLADLGPSEGTVPNREMLLRWTSAFDAKAKKYLEYRRKEVVGPTDSFVIAIDGSQLCKVPFTHGVTQLPFVVEVVFPIGGLALQIDPDTGKIVDSSRTVEAFVVNRNKAPIPKVRFLQPDFSGISAVLGCYANISSAVMLPVQVAYNPLAQIPIPPHRFGAAAEEWTAVLHGSGEAAEWSLERLRAGTAEGQGAS